MKNLKSISALAAALLSTSVFAGGLGLGLGADVNAGAGVGVGGIGGLGVQSNVRQQVDADVGLGAVRSTARQAVGVQGDASIDERSRSGTQSSSVNSAGRADVGASSSTMRETDRYDRRATANGAAAADVTERVSTGVGSGTQRVLSGVRGSATTAGQSIQGRERRLDSNAAVSGSVRASEQARRDRAASTSLKATVKQNAELYSGG